MRRNVVDRTPARALDPAAATRACGKAMDYMLMAYMAAISQDILLRRSLRYYQAARPNTRYNDAHKVGQTITTLQALLARMEVSADRMDDRIFAELGARDFDQLRRNANELTRFAMAFFDRTLRRPEATERINALFSELESGTVFTDEEIASLGMR